MSIKTVITFPDSNYKEVKEFYQYRIQKIQSMSETLKRSRKILKEAQLEYIHNIIAVELVDIFDTLIKEYNDIVIIAEECINATT